MFGSGISTNPINLGLLAIGKTESLSLLSIDHYHSSDTKSCFMVDLYAPAFCRTRIDLNNIEWFDAMSHIRHYLSIDNVR